MCQGYGWNQILQAFVLDLVVEKLFSALNSTDTAKALLAYSILSVVKAAAVSWIALKMTFSADYDEARKQAAGKAHSLKTPRTSRECASFVLWQSLIFTAAWGEWCCTVGRTSMGY